MPSPGDAPEPTAAIRTASESPYVQGVHLQRTDANVREIAAQGARVYRVNGLIDDCGKIVGDGAAAGNWFDMSTLKEPYRIEGKKTMGLELAEQLGEGGAGEGIGGLGDLDRLAGRDVDHGGLEPRHHVGEAHRRAGAGRRGLDHPRLVLRGLGVGRLERDGRGGAAEKKGADGGVGVAHGRWGPLGSSFG